MLQEIAAALLWAERHSLFARKGALTPSYQEILLRLNQVVAEQRPASKKFEFSEEGTATKASILARRELRARW